MFSVGFLLICLCTSAIAGNSSSALNITGSNVSTISTSQLPFGIDLPKSIRNESNHTIHTILTAHPAKVKVTGAGAKHNKVGIAVNTTNPTKTVDNVTLSTTLRNLTHHMKNSGHRSSSSRFIDRLASKLSLVSLTSSKVSDESNKTSSLRNERASVNATLIEMKNATDRINKTIEKRSVNNSTITDRASSFFQTLPALLVNTTSNVTSWAKRLFGNDKDSSAKLATKKVTRDTTAELKSLVNTTESKTSRLNSTGKGQSTAATVSDKREENGNNSSSSLLNLTATILKRDTGNLTADIPTVKESNSSVINSTGVGIKRDSKIVEVHSKRLNNITVESKLDVANLTREIPEKTNSSLISESSASLSHRIRRHFNGVKSGYKVPSRPAYWMPVVTTPKSIPAKPATPAYGMPPSVPSQTNGMAPAAAYGMAPPAPASSYGMTPALPTPAAPVYITPATYAPPAAAAPSYGMAPALPAPPAAAAPSYGMTPALPAPSAAAAPSYGMTPALPAPPAAAAPSYGMTPALPTPAAPVYDYFTSAPYAPASAYGMVPAAAVPAYGMAPAPPAPAAPVYDYTTQVTYAPPTASPPVYGMAPAASVYSTPAPYAPAYEQSTESYYTAPRPSYTTSAPYNLQPTASPYGVSASPVSYPAQPYGSMSSRPSPTGSPWY